MKMKCLFAFAVIALFAVGAAGDDSCRVGFWFDAPKNIGMTNTKGVAFGIPVFDGRSVEGAELSLIGSLSKEMSGFQWAWFGFTSAERFQAGLQWSFVNFAHKQLGGKGVGVQLGFFNQSGKDGFQIGFLNNCLNNAKFQFGLINVNNNGWLPIMIFVNFSKEAFN